MPGVGVCSHDADGVVQDEVDGAEAVVWVEGEGAVGGCVEAVEVGDRGEGVGGGCLVGGGASGVGVQGGLEEGGEVEGERGVGLEGGDERRQGREVEEESGIQRDGR